MTATMTPVAAPEQPEPPKAKGFAGRKNAASAVKISLSGEPTVQLLPSSIRERAVGRSRLRTAALIVILGIVVAAALFALATLRLGQAQQSLLEANNRTTELLAEQARYADAVKIADMVAQVEELQLGATATEIDWAALMRELFAKLPDGAEIASIDAVGTVPWAAVPTDPASPEVPQLATVTFMVSSVTIQDATAFSRSLTDLEGFAHVRLETIGVGTDGEVSSKLTLVMTTGAESGRFVVDDGTAAEPEAGTESETEGE